MIAAVSLCFPQLLTAAGSGDAPSVAESAANQEGKRAAKKKAAKPDRKEKKGKLDSFEEEATKKKATKKKAADDDEDDDGDEYEYYEGDDYEYEGDHDWIGPIFRVLGDLALRTVVAGGRSSWAKVHGSEVSFEHRELGEPLVPFFSIDARYQDIAADLQATNSRVELGYGPIATQFDWTRYDEWNPRDRLDLTEWHVLYRMSGGPHFGLDAGLGAMTINGSTTMSAFSLALPLRVQPVRSLGISFRPVWGWFDNSVVSDYAVELSLGVSFVFMHGGYRWVKAGDVSLAGPVVGVSFHL
jgi:hypothetical protein